MRHVLGISAFFHDSAAVLLGEEDLVSECLAMLEQWDTEYAKFVEGAGARAPKHWNGNVPPVAIRDQPVVGVTAAEADAYANSSSPAPLGGFDPSSAPCRPGSTSG